MQALSTILLKDAIADSEIIFSARTAVLPTSVRYLNASELGYELFSQRVLHGAYYARQIEFDPVRLGRLPDALLLGGNSNWVLVGDVPVLDQISPLTQDRASTLQALRALQFPIEEVEEPCVLVARYGDVTWGHWLAEILPRAVIAERACPGRFRFVVPAQITTRAESRSYADAVLESLAAYDIGEDRLIRTSWDRNYRFHQLYALDALWNVSAVINPDVLGTMRDALPPPRGSWPHRLAVLRPDTKTRNISNVTEVADWLQADGFAVTDIAQLSFLDQVDAFRHGDTVFGVLGSGLVGLMYSPDAVKVVSAAPGSWADSYFYMLIQLRQGYYADIRGSVLWDGEGLERDAPFVVHRKHLTAALARLDAPDEELTSDGMVSVGGVELARNLHRKLVELIFSNDGNASEFLGDGWQPAEPGLIWSSGLVSTLRLPFRHPQDNYVLELELFAFATPPYLAAQRLEVVVNGVAVATLPVSNFTRVACRLPVAALNSDALEFAFHHPLFPPLRALGIAADDRPLAVAFRRLRLWST